MVDALALGTRISEYMTTMSAKSDSGYQCLICSRQSRDLFNHRGHMLTHMRKDETELLNELDQLIDSYVYKQGAGIFSCLVCKTVLKRGLMGVRAHFIMKHIGFV